MHSKQEKQQFSNLIAGASSSVIDWLLQTSPSDSTNQVRLTKFSKAFEIKEFQLGEIIATFPSTEAFYLLCQGQVR